LKDENMQTTIAETTPAAFQPEHVLVFWDELLSLYPVSKSTWLKGVAEGRYPAPVRLSAKKIAWRRSSIIALIAGL
jgi:predicted DNA-binding transcriptional regulator AlpA